MFGFFKRQRRQIDKVLDITTVLDEYTPLINNTIVVRGDFMWSIGRCWIAECGTPANHDALAQGILLKAPGLWRRRLLVLARLGVKVTNMGPAEVKGILEVSEIEPFPLMLSSLTNLVLDIGPNDAPMVIDLRGLGEIETSEYEGIMFDKYLSTDDERKSLLVRKRLECTWW